jgi:chemotaxis protein methyltransferase CheR
VEYLSLLKADADALDDLLVATTIGETYFFRDLGQFQIISDLVLPDIRRRRGHGHTIRFWSAGCASGEEAYSLAMLLHRSGALSRASILGTDISREALALARTAIYRECSLRADGVKMAKPYLTQKDGQYHVNATMKKSVRFDYLNLAVDNYPSIRSGTRGMDLILCRNVLLYYDPQTIHSVVGRLSRSLAEGGWLIIASSDPPIHEFDMFDFVPTEHGLAYRKANLSLTANSVADPHASGALDVSTSGAVSGAATRNTSKVAKPLRKQRLAEARQALAGGDYQQAADLTTDLRGEGAIIHIKALANIDVALAAKACAAETSKRPLSQQLNYLNAVLMMDLNRHHEAAESLRRVLYLDESLALVHFKLGTALRKLRDVEGAQRAFRSTVEICDRSPPDQPVPLGDDETAGELRALAKTQLEAIE